uniref:F-box domain-containing protein n=1 Tax=Rhodnius prolixus TaxID=13249 RepID=T1HFN8_RHOPR
MDDIHSKLKRILKLLKNSNMSVTKKQLSDLPVEMKEHILTKVDGTSLLRMRCVSKEWKQILDDPPLPLKKKWKEVCLAEIEFCSLRKILENLDPKFYIHHKLDIWKTAYSNWHQWLCLPKWSFTQKVLHKLSNCEITSVVNSDKPSLSDFSHDRVRLIFENSLRGDLNMHTLKIDYDEELTGDNQVFYFGTKVIKIDTREDHSYITLTKNPGKVRKITLFNYWSIEHCWTNRNLFSCRRIYYEVFDDKLRPVDNHPFSYLPMLHAWRKSIKCYSGDSVIISVNMEQFIEHEMIIQVLGKVKKYRPFDDISVHFTSIVYHGMMLFAGTDIGTLYVYKAKHFYDLLSLKLSKPFAKFEFGNEAIVSIALKETSGKPIIWAASFNQIYQIAFFSE